MTDQTENRSEIDPATNAHSVNEFPKVEMSRTEQNWWLLAGIAALMLIGYGVYEYQKPVRSYSDYWSEKCKARMAGEAADRLLRGY